jgi:hypothetical protein
VSSFITYDGTALCSPITNEEIVVCLRLSQMNGRAVCLRLSPIMDKCCVSACHEGRKEPKRSRYCIMSLKHHTIGRSTPLYCFEITLDVSHHSIHRQVYINLKFTGDAIIEKCERRGKKLLELVRNLEVGGQWRRKAKTDGTLTFWQERATTKRTSLNSMVSVQA